MKQVLFSGDSNTWGLVPGSKTHERYPWGVRWTSLLQERYSEKDITDLNGNAISVDSIDACGCKVYRITPVT